MLAVKSWLGEAEMRDLTVADIHTYYIVADETDILVHNVDPNCPVHGASSFPGSDARRCTCGPTRTENLTGENALDTKGAIEEEIARTETVARSSSAAIKAVKEGAADPVSAATVAATIGGVLIGRAARSAWRLIRWR